MIRVLSRSGIFCFKKTVYFPLKHCENPFWFEAVGLATSSVIHQYEERERELYFCRELSLHLIKDFCVSISFLMLELPHQARLMLLKKKCLPCFCWQSVKLISKLPWMILSHSGIKNTKWAFLCFPWFPHASPGIFHMSRAVGSEISPIHFPWSLTECNSCETCLKLSCMYMIPFCIFLCDFRFSITSTLTQTF